MIISWTHENNNTHWSEELRFVQFKKKTRSYHRTIDQSPYSVLFGSDPKVGLSSSAIPKEILDTLETEEDLYALTTTETLILPIEMTLIKQIPKRTMTLKLKPTPNLKLKPTPKQEQTPQPMLIST